MAFAVIALLWASFGHIDVVAVAQGKIVPNAGSKLIQPIETATVKAIHVIDGQAVKAGQVLVELDATMARADSTRTANDLTAARLASGARPRPAGGARLGQGAAHRSAGRRRRRARRARTAHPRRPVRRIPGPRPAHRRRNRQARSRAALDRRDRAQAGTNRPIARQRAEDFKGLVEKNFISKHGYLEKEQVRIEQEADLQTQKSRIKELAAAIAEARASARR
jgi:hemolysin D